MHFCDLECTYASFPDSSAVDGSGSCRTFIALYCAKKRSLVHKNLPCADKAVKNATSCATRTRKSRKTKA